MAKAKVTTKVKKKQWVSVVAPKIFANKVLGETYVSEPKQAIGRTLEHNLKDLTGGIKDQNVYITFRIKTWSNDQLGSEIIGYSTTPASLKRVVRRNTSRIDGIYTFTTGDGKNVLLKFVIQTLNRAQRSVRTALQHRAREKLAADLAKLNYGNLIDKLVSRKLHQEMKKELTKIYPTKNFALRQMTLLTEGKETEDMEETMTEEQPENLRQAQEEVPSDESSSEAEDDLQDVDDEESDAEQDAGEDEDSDKE